METELEHPQMREDNVELPKDQGEFDWGDEEEEKKHPFQNISATGILNRIGDILLLHFAVLICSLPIITIGASVSAGAYVGIKLASGMEGGVLGNFIKGFKENFKRSTIYFLIAIVGLVLVYNSYRYWMSIGAEIGNVMACVSVGLAVVWVMYVLYVFAVQAKFENSLLATAKNAVLMAVRHFHITALMAFIIVVVVWLFMEFMAVQAVMAVSGFGIIFYVQGKLYNIVFKSYIN